MKIINRHCFSIARLLALMADARFGMQLFVVTTREPRQSGAVSVQSPA